VTARDVRIRGTQPHIADVRTAYPHCSAAASSEGPSLAASAPLAVPARHSLLVTTVHVFVSHEAAVIVPSGAHAAKVTPDTRIWDARLPSAYLHSNAPGQQGGQTLPVVGGASGQVGRTASVATSFHFPFTQTKPSPPPHVSTMQLVSPEQGMPA